VHRARAGDREGPLSDPAIKLTTYFDERDRSGSRFMADALFDIYERHRMRTSVLLRGALGFGQRHALHGDRLLTPSESLPAVSIAVDTRERIEDALGDVLSVAQHGLISLERAELVCGEAIGSLARPAEQTVKLTVYGGRAIRSGGQPGYVAALGMLREAGAAGASVLLGVDGTLHGERRRARFFARNEGVPLMLLALGSGAALGGALPALVELIYEPVLTIERVRICRSIGQTLAEPGTVPERDQSGLPIWQKIMVHAEEQAKYDGRPLYLELARRLAQEGAPGVTVLRGVRGFYAGSPDYADRLLSLRRNVPVHVVALDTPAGVQRWWPVLESLTAQSGLVTSEIVPASHAHPSSVPPTLELARITPRHD
jgi:PII-like signaling protein